MAKHWLNDDGEFLFGKHEGEHVNDVVKYNPNYVLWLLENVEDVEEGDREFLEVVYKGWKNRKGG